MKISSSLKIRGNPWKIKFPTEVIMPDDGRSLLGLCDPNIHTISVKAGMSNFDTLETLIHEYIHACSYEQGLHDEVDSVIEHMYVNAVAKDMAINSSFWKKLFQQLG